VAALKRRDRLVIFRLTQDEFEGLKAACAERGASSLSAFARSELLNSLHGDRLSDVHRQLSTLQSSVKHMTQILETIRASPASPKESA
jgi:hypothetical protein